jgi:hypothetical protein
MARTQTLNAKYPDGPKRIGIVSVGSILGTDDSAI